MRTWRGVVPLGALAALGGCGVSPISHRIPVGEQPYVVFVGEGRDGRTDLFAALTGGGEVAQLTFTPLLEAHPTLTIVGDRVAFLRIRDTLAATPQAIVVMNLISGSERQVDLPSEAGRVRALAWTRDEQAIVARTDRGIWRIAAPPLPAAPAALSGADFAEADTLLTDWLGEPRFARALACPQGGVCVLGPSGDTTVLAQRGESPLRWGNDSVAWFDSDGMVVRSLGPGPERRLTWRNAPQHPRDGWYAPGPAPSDSTRP